MNRVDKVMLGAVAVVSATLIAFPLLVGPKVFVVAEEPKASLEVKEAKKATVAMVNPNIQPKVSASELSQMQDMGIVGDQRTRVLHILAIHRRRVMDTWKRMGTMDRSDARQLAMEVQLSLEEDLRRELGDKWPAWEDARREAMGLSRRWDAATD